MKKLSPILCVLVAASVLLAASARPAACWYFASSAPAPENQAEPNPQAADKAAKPAGTSDDDLLLLSDDEVFHNKKVLKSLKQTNPKEVEELIDNNPLLEEIVLRRIQARLERESAYPVLKLKPKKVYGYPGVVHHNKPQTHHHHEQQQQQLQQQQQEYLEDLDEENSEESDDANEQVVDKKKYDSLKEKLKSNAAKIFKMGSGFKEKYAALRNKYKVKKVSKDMMAATEPQTEVKVKFVEKDKEKERHKIPKFYNDVSH